MKVASYFYSLVVLVLFLSGCSNNINENQANAIAKNYVKKKMYSSDDWYVSESASKAGEWVIHIKTVGNDCEEKIIYIDKKNGSVLESRDGNVC